MRFAPAPPPPHRCRSRSVHTCAGAHHFVWCHACGRRIDVVACDHGGDPPVGVDELNFDPFFADTP